MLLEFWNGYSLAFEHFPGRKKPVAVLSRDGEYMGHAVFKDEESLDEFKRFAVKTMFNGGGWKREDS